MRIVVLHRILALCLAGSALVIQNTAIANDWLRVTVCDLLRAPEQFLGKDVEVAGQTEGHWFESAPDHGELKF